MLKIILLCLAFFCPHTNADKKRITLKDKKIRLWDLATQRGARQIESAESITKTVSCAEVPSSVLLEPGDVVKFTSPGYLSKYSRADCGWKFKAKRIGELITVHCSDFRLRGLRNGFCREYVAVGSKRYCGNDGPEYVRNVKNVEIKFLRSKKKTKIFFRGFSCTASVPKNKNDTNIEKCVCGKANSIPRIVGGEKTEVAEYPWQVALVSQGDDEPWCGGTLLNNEFVLSAAHCMDETPEVLLGKHYYKSEDKDIIRMKVKKVIKHPKFSWQTVKYDFSLLKLEYRLDLDILSPEIRPVCLPTIPSGGQPNLYEDVSVVVSGWGYTSDGGQPPDELHDVTVKTMSNSKCKKKYPGHISSSMICAARPDKDSCSGDSGGPMVWKAGSYFELIGVVSWGVGCAEPHNPGVYSRVTSALEWINAKMTKNTKGCPRPS